MYYIYPHTDSKIIKLGFGSMALYREKKPDKKDYYAIPDDAIKADNCFSETIFKMDFTNWQESRIGYIKEPEWKDIDIGQTYYFNGANGLEAYTIKTIDGSGNVILWDNQHIERITTNTKDFDKRFTHYYPGQQVESFKYVREEEVRAWKYEWQEVEEPEITKLKWLENKAMNDYTQFQEELKSGVILAEVITKK